MYFVIVENGKRIDEKRKILWSGIPPVGSVISVAPAPWGEGETMKKYTILGYEFPVRVDYNSSYCVEATIVNVEEIKTVNRKQEAYEKNINR